MKLYYDKRSKNPTYFIQQGIRNGKKTTTRNIKVIGKHNDLLKITDDPLEYAKQKVKEYNEDYKNNKLKLDISIDFDKKLPSSENIVAQTKNVNIGYFYLQSIYNDLHIKDFIDQMVSKTRIKFDCNIINRFLTFARILDPRSKLGIYDHLNIYYEQPVYHYENSLRFMTLLYNKYDEYITHLFDNSSHIIKRDTSLCYFDCTNFYFEIDEADDDYVDEITGEVISGFRKHGISKEHRPNPIVQMGLFMDGKGIPITMCLNPGNQNEQLCATTTEEKMIKMFKNKEIIYCADAGLGSYDIRKFNSFGKRSFIITQSIKKLGDTVKEAVFNDFEYRLLSSNQEISVEFMKSFDRTDPTNRSLYDDTVYKVIPADKAIDLGLEEEYITKSGQKSTRKAKGELKQYIIVTFSRKTMEYQRHVRNKQIERARKIIKSNKVDRLNKNQNDPKRFIKKDGKTKDKYYIDEDMIKEEEKYDGFYAVATNLDAPNDYKKILEHNAMRYKIEDCFRILKTYFKARPVNHSTKNRIIAHFMTCYTALLIYRLLEVKLDEHGTHFTTSEIIENLKNMNVVNNHDLYYQATYTSSKLCDALNEVFQLDLDKEYYHPKDLNKKLKKISK
jgi:hypothetical protein